MSGLLIRSGGECGGKTSLEGNNSSSICCATFLVYFLTSKSLPGSQHLRFTTDYKILVRLTTDRQLKSCRLTALPFAVRQRTVCRSACCLPARMPVSISVCFPKESLRDVYNNQCRPAEKNLSYETGGYRSKRVHAVKLHSTDWCLRQKSSRMHSLVTVVAVLQRVNKRDRPLFQRIFFFNPTAKGKK